METKEMQYMLFNAEFNSLSVGWMYLWLMPLRELLNVRILWHAFFEQCTFIIS